MDNWENYEVTYKNPKFGSEGKVFEDKEWHMIVGTQLGSKDAKSTCLRHHKGCKVVKVQLMSDVLVKESKPKRKSK